jgi:4'-phosphopantetheinyl transferase
MRTVDTYWMNLDAAEREVDAFARTLSDDELQRAGRFRFQRDRQRYILRRGRLRQLLSQYLGGAPAALVFDQNSFGKPSLRGSELRFNISHSHGLALFAVADGIEIGCDIERHDPQFAAEQIPERFFAADEVRTLRALPPARQTDAFFRCWTRKEAYIKARGRGLSIPLDSFEVSLAPDGPAALLRGCDGWTVQSFEPVSGYEAAVVAQGAGWQLNRLPLAA